MQTTQHEPGYKKHVVADWMLRFVVMINVYILHSAVLYSIYSILSMPIVYIDAFFCIFNAVIYNDEGKTQKWGKVLQPSLDL